MPGTPTPRNWLTRKNTKYREMSDGKESNPEVLAAQPVKELNIPQENISVVSRITKGTSLETAQKIFLSCRGKIPFHAGLNLSFNHKQLLKQSIVIANATSI